MPKCHLAFIVLLTMAGDGMLSGKTPTFSLKIAPSFAVCNWGGNKRWDHYPMPGGAGEESKIQTYIGGQYNPSKIVINC